MDSVQPTVGAAALRSTVDTVDDVQIAFGRTAQASQRGLVAGAVMGGLGEAADSISTVR